MALGTRAAGILEEIARQIGLGRPEEVAERIAEGRLDMRPEAVAERQQALFPEIFYSGTTSPNILDNEVTNTAPQFMYMSKSPGLAASYAGRMKDNFPTYQAPSVYPFAVNTQGMDRVLGEGATWNTMQSPLILPEGDASKAYRVLDPDTDEPFTTTTDDMVEFLYEMGGKGTLFENVQDVGPYYDLLKSSIPSKTGTPSQFEIDNYMRELETNPPTNLTVPDTSRVRALYGAAFDPEYKGSNILGDRAIPVAGAGLLAAAAMSPEEAEAGPLSAAARAAKQGFTNKQYHASMQDFDRIVPGYDDGLFFTTPNPEFASDWAGKGKLQNREGELDSYDRYRPQKEKLYEEMGSPEFGTPKYDEFVNRSSEIYRQEQNAFKTVYPLLARTEKTFDPEKNFDDIADLFDEGRLNAPFSAEYPTFADALKGGNYMLYENPEVVGHLKSKGYDSMFLRESTGSEEAREAPYTTVAHFYPDRNIRSQFAEFAEGYTGPNILGGTAAAATGLGLLGMPQESFADTAGRLRAENASGQYTTDYEAARRANQAQAYAPRSETLQNVTMALRDLERRLEGSPASLLFPSGYVQHLEEFNRPYERSTYLGAALGALDFL